MATSRNARTSASNAPQVQQNLDREAEEDNEDTAVWETQRKKSKKVKPSFICKGGTKVCGLAISDREDSVMCDLCEEWYHPKCQGLTIDAFRALSNYDFIWLCVECKPNFMNMLKMGQKIENRIEAAEQKILRVLETTGTKSNINKQFEDKLISFEKVVVGKMEEQQLEAEKALKAQKEVAESMPQIQHELKKSAHELKKIVEQNEDKEKRQANIIIHNIPESKASSPDARKQYDTDSFRNIVEALLGENENVEINKIYRLGKKRESTEEEEHKPRRCLSV